ncbi:MAG: hypothetical protein LBQ01_00185 [Prevotellaceae bacterium]|nr:hypothetical protein [Prevotellaceae bacterium]
MSKTQHFRITNCYGEQVSSIIENGEATSIPETLPSETVVYAESDGSMILTRKKKEYQPFNSWEEVKLLRTYKSGDKLSTLKRSTIEKSEYVAHLGNHQEFESKAEQLPDKYEHLGKNLVFISDGACRIHKWQTESYPKATQILDYYHVCEHMAAFALIAIPNETERKIWLDKRKEELLESQSERVCKQIRKIADKEDCNKITKEANNLINYFATNKKRMNYKQYLERGLQIGSGAIESANRNVVQAGMKQSGQRWSRKRAQYILDLRTCHMSGKWNIVIDLIRDS